MPDPTETLADWKAKTDAATAGPWEDDGTNVAQATGKYLDITPHQVSCMSYCYGGTPEPMTDADRQFIAVSRTAMPVLLSAVENVLALHTECHCRDTVQETENGPLVIGAHCRVCDSFTWPCATVRAIESALGGDDDAK